MNVIDLDKKEKVILEHYKKKIEGREFDEFDILGFLISFRRHFKSNNKLAVLSDFADLIAHRQRNRGRALDSIKAAKDLNYELIDGTKVKGYNGIKTEEWDEVWRCVSEFFEVNLSEQTIDEIMLCLFSLIQFSVYESGGLIGEIKLFQLNDGSLALMSSENKTDSLFICFSKWGNYNFIKKYVAGIIDEPVFTERQGETLRLRSDSEYVI